MELTTLPDSWFGLLGLIVTTSGTLVMTWMTFSKKRDSDEKDKDAEPAIAEAEKKADWSPAVHALAGELQDLRVVVDRLQQRYPEAINIIRVFDRDYPDHTVYISPRIREDM